LKALTQGTPLLEIEAVDSSHLPTEHLSLKSNGHFGFNPWTTTGQTKGPSSHFPANDIEYLPHPQGFLISKYGRLFNPTIDQHIPPGND